MKHVQKCCFFAAIIILLFCVTACSGITGYGVLLWSLPEYNLSDCDIVPVYIKSNISQVFVIGVPGTDQKIEVPLWQITDPVSKRKANQQAERYLTQKNIYARVVLDGLPMRSDAVNTSKQVYKLRENEIIKILYKGKGAAVMSGSNAMEGDWYRVMASDGTMGWCFSYNLRLFNENEQVITETVVEEKKDEYLEQALSSKWYPDVYGDMVRYNRVSIEQMKTRPAFDTGAESGTIHLDINDISVSFPYNGVTTTQEFVYKFNDAPLIMTIRRTGYIVLQYTDNSGKPQAFDLVTLAQPVEEIITQELERRQTEYEMLYDFGPGFKSSNYGSLVFCEDGSFVWKKYDALVPSVIPSGSGQKGSVSLKYFLDTKLAFSYDGVLALTFEKTGKEVIFLYKREDNGIRLENVSSSNIKDAVVQNRLSNPMVMYFAIDPEAEIPVVTKPAATAADFGITLDSIMPELPVKADSEQALEIGD